MEQDQAKELTLSIAFDTVMRNPDARAQYKEHCTRERNDEYILFIEAVEAYRLLKQPHERAAKKSEIMKKFLQADAEYLLNLSKQVMDEQVAVINEATVPLELFNQLEKIVRKTIIPDSFTRFYESSPLKHKLVSI